MNPLTLAELRRDIDALDSQLIGLLARRQRLVEQAGRLDWSVPMSETAFSHD